MGLQDLLHNWRSHTVASTSAVVSEEELAADVDEPPDHRSKQYQQADFYKSTVQSQGVRKESLITKGLHKDPEKETSKPEVQVTTDLSRRRSMISNASVTSTAELTSDGDLTSPARTNTPSPPPPNYTSFAPYSFGPKLTNPASLMVGRVKIKDEAHAAEYLSLSPKALPPATAPPKQRGVSFQCGKMTQKPTPPVVVAPAPVTPAEPPKPRTCKIKFACAMKPSEERIANSQTENTSDLKVTDAQKQITSRPTLSPRKSPRLTTRSSPRPHRDSSSTVRRASQSPQALRVKPKYINADEQTLKSSEATRFHEFASGEVQEDDWIRRDAENPKAKLTINDTLKMENAIRKLGNEVEEEALEEDEEEEAEEEEEDEAVNYSDDDDGFGEEDDDDFGSDDGSDDGSDGNETDNEAGFAESDESDVEGEFAFWTPGRNIALSHADASTYRASAHRAASASSIDSLGHLDSVLGPKGARKPRRRPIRIRPGTPELPDSTDFVCGTLDEDRPIENAYISCMEARKNAKHKRTPQDIDPSFPTSDLDDEEDDEDLVEGANESDEQVWLHGNFEESDHEGDRRRTAASKRKSPLHSPKRLHSPPPPRRLHSPPPPRQRLRSPPPRKLFGHSPKRMRSPPPARGIRSPAASPTTQDSKAINFAPLAQRPGLTHTKSLPRAPNAFGRQYRASRIAAANGHDGSDSADGHVRGAIAIVKGLERKRQRRKEKFQCKGRKHHSERKPQPGKGAERMRELGLLMAGKTGVQNPYMMSA
ncbi:hypothetical protein LHYA1_G007427 [Lachnellula hyalina]|uniref:Uncharacterized protein n=1 Tax=Lachnellula hyalina TaxID=1316788 RepID=A0A8H8QWK3_9HELO|nr:uncharacterized protein LHYA1_G007427 [Lachnellula hyalina]TVY23495.1 hypothetical protein LHYA1_G007427 [Lachnellula hyalina]